jgi:exodeoxyribonuclease V gamma subunit
MAGLTLYMSNRLETLAKKLAECVRLPTATPLDNEIIIIQSRGMERWVSMSLARHNGICANVKFPFPNVFVQDIFQKLLTDIPEKNDFDPNMLMWRILKILPAFLETPAFESLKTYIESGPENIKRFQLCARIADTFDQYLLFRTEMILGWEKGREDHWQAILWRKLMETSKGGHRAGLGKRLLGKLRGGRFPLAHLPQRISVFGISALPRFHVQILGGISQYIPVNLFLMNPCREYWGDILSEWEIKKESSVTDLKDSSVEILHFEKGNRLLASMGQLGRDFFELLNDLDPRHHPLFKEVETNSLLSSIQSDILHLADIDKDTYGKRMIEPDDSSIQIHSCHGAMREMEVLYDQLLHMFEKYPDLKPKDILVMTPDIEIYAPYIQAVFDAPHEEAGRIPYSIADRSIKIESDIMRAFFGIIEFGDGRFNASQVLSVLESSAVRRRFEILDNDLETIRKWVNDTRIRWGIDGQSKGNLGLPQFAENTWKSGLERLLLGYALPGHEERLFEGILPYDHMEGSDTHLLGNFLTFIHHLFSHVTSLAVPRPLDEWFTILTDMIGGMFLPDEEPERDIQRIHRFLYDLRNMEEVTGFKEKIDIRIIKWLMERFFEKRGWGYGFLTGGVTFCAMLPMRSIPFKVICLVGMDNTAFPRQLKPISFDLMARHPQLGDRSRRNDDRYLFLETILSARKKLYISYVGQSIHDNTPIPPSVLVSELLDYIQHGFEVTGTDIVDHVVTRHRLQAFNPEYFKDDPKRLSYSEQNFLAAQGLQSPRRESIPFISTPLPDSRDETEIRVNLNDLCRFFTNPCRYLLNKQLGIFMEDVAVMEDRESFEPTSLEKYALEERLLERRLKGQSIKEMYSLSRSAGRLPHGTVGECLFEQMCNDVEAFAKETEMYISDKALDPLEVDLRMGDFRLTGKIQSIYPQRLIQYRYAKLRPKDYLRAWIFHLALNSHKSDGYPKNSMLMGLDPNASGSRWIAMAFPPLKNSKDLLQQLIELYGEGLERPIPFFPDSSWAYAYRMIKGDANTDGALFRAANVWVSDYYRGESEDPYYRLCFNNRNPLDSEFQKKAMDILKPLITNLRRFEHAKDEAIPHPGNPS